MQNTADQQTRSVDTCHTVDQDLFVSCAQQIGHPAAEAVQQIRVWDVIIFDRPDDG